MSFTVGTRVIIQNLVLKPHYNGKDAIVTSLPDDNNRYEVFILESSQKIQVKGTNLFDMKEKLTTIKSKCVSRCLDVIVNFIIQHERWNPVEFNVRSRIETELTCLVRKENMQSEYTTLMNELTREPWNFLVEEQLEKMKYCRIPRYKYKLIY